MVVGFGDASDSNLCGDNFDNNFLEKRICGRDFVVNNRNVLFVDELASLDYLCTSNNYWRIEFMAK